MCKAIGVDFYNQSVTGEVTKPITAKNADTDHIPCVIVKRLGVIEYKEDGANELPTDNRND